MIEEGGETWIELKNEKGDILKVPFKFLEIYKNCPERLFSKITKVIEDGRELEIGINEDEMLDADDTERNVKVSYSEKYIFTKKEEDNDFLFPELVHGGYVELEGHTTRGNENANTIGFEYLRHVLTCNPIHGNIIQYRHLLFTNCMIKGYVNREDEYGNVSERKPKIHFISLEELPNTNPQLELFNKH